MPSSRSALAAAVAGLLALPGLASAVPVVIYPPDGARSRAELGEVAGLLQSAMNLAAARGGRTRSSTSGCSSA